MNIYAVLAARITDILQVLEQEGRLPSGVARQRFTVEPTRDPAHGDMACNAAMALAKTARTPPETLAGMIAERLQGSEHVLSAQVARPGFINLRLDAAAWLRCLRTILSQGQTFGDSASGAGQPINVEYVSANPTGPMHVGHARGAVVGDVLASLLQKAGFNVTREYYINDGGAQVDALAQSAYLRYREAHGETITIPDGLYPGTYLKAVGVALKERYGASLIDQPESQWLKPVRTFAVAAMMDLIRADLEMLGVRHDVFTSEQTLVDAGLVDRAAALLEQHGLIYTGVLEPPKGKVQEDWEERPQTLFRSSRYGDDTDRPLRKSDGSWTYFAADIACHFDKYSRGFTDMINVWGADHAGYVKRLQAAVQALSAGKARLDVQLCQLVRLMDRGQPLKMSKRAGSFTTLRDLLDAVGKDAVRFFMLTRRSDAPLDFDLNAVLEQSRDNPVFYVQYAHARCCSLERLARDTFPDMDLSREALQEADLAQLMEDAEIDLIKKMASWPRIVEAAAEAREPHRIAFYLQELAAAFHGLWNLGREEKALRFICPEDRARTMARMALIIAVRQVIASGFGILGITPVEELR